MHIIFFDIKLSKRGSYYILLCGCPVVHVTHGAHYSSQKKKKRKRNEKKKLKLLLPVNNFGFKTIYTENHTVLDRHHCPRDLTLS